MGNQILAIAGMLATTAIMVAQAADCTFPNAGGELSVPGGWGDNAPGVSDSIIINQNGNYTISSDLEVLGIVATADSPSITASDGVKITLNAVNKGSALLGKVNKMNGLQLSGGFYYTPNEASVFPLYAYNLDYRQPGSTATLSGVSISNLYIFAAANRFSDAKTTLINGCNVWARTLQVGSGVGSGCTLEVTDGSRIFSLQHLYPDGSNDNGGHNLLVVSGAGSLVSIGASTYSGNYAGTNSILVTDCATFSETQAMMLGRNFGGDSCTFQNCSTGLLAGVELGSSASGACSNSFSVLSGSYVTANSVVVGNYSSGNTLIVDDSTLIANGGLKIGNSKSEAATDNTVIMRGKNAQIEVASGQWITSCNRATFRFEVPETGYARVPLKSSHCQWLADVTFEVECKKFRRAGGGDIELVQAGASTWIDQNTDGNLASRLTALNASQPEGCYFSISGAKVIYHAPYLPPKGTLISFQ